MTIDPNEFAAQPEDMQRVMIELQYLRNADSNLYGRGRPNWEAKRRLVIYAPCCIGREPLLEVMETDPPCVFIGQVTISKDAVARFADDESKRGQWQGMGRSRGDESQGPALLSTFERMAATPTKVKQYVWCRHQRWAIFIGDVVTMRGRHVLPLPDKTHHTM